MEEKANDISEYTITEACNRLVSLICESSPPDDPYIEPYCNYVSMWPRSLPLKCIVIGQDPYPRDIFSTISAAMSYDTDRCIKEMRMSVPPTVSILANDLYVNAGVDKELTIQCIKDGWKLASMGILLVNHTVLRRSSVDDWRHSILQIELIVRLLRETEKYGRSKVTIFAMGNRSEAALNEISSTFKSKIVTISSCKVMHPASLSRRFDDFNDANCHMNNPTFSKKFSELICNQVAYKYVMAPRESADEVKKRHFADSLTQVANGSLEGLGLGINDWVDTVVVVSKKMSGHSDDLDESIIDLIEKTKVLSTRVSIVVAMFRGLDVRNIGIASQVAKPAPHVSLVSPTQEVINRHVGKAPSSAPRTAMEVESFVPKSKNKAPPPSSSLTVVSSASGVLSMDDTTSSATPPIKPSIKKVTPEIESFVVKPKQSRGNKKQVNPPVPEYKPPVVKDKNPNIITTRSNEPRSTTASVINPTIVLTKEVIAALSCVEAVIQSYGVDTLDEDIAFTLESISSDVSSKSAYNDATQKLVVAINKDIANDPKFDFIVWAVNRNLKSCNTLNVCKEIFNFT